MTARTFGILAGILTSAFGAWWYSRRRAVPVTTAPADRGTVSYHNAPTATPLSSEGIL